MNVILRKVEVLCVILQAFEGSPLQSFEGFNDCMPSLEGLKECAQTFEGLKDFVCNPSKVWRFEGLHVRLCVILRIVEGLQSFHNALKDWRILRNPSRGLNVSFAFLRRVEGLRGILQPLGLKITFVVFQMVEGLLLQSFQGLKDCAWDWAQSWTKCLNLLQRSLKHA